MPTETRSKMAAVRKASPYVAKNVITYVGEPKPRISPHERARILVLHLQKHSYREIARRVGHSITGVIHTIRRWRQTHSLSDRKHPGPRPKISPQLLRQLDQLLDGPLENWEQCVEPH